MAAEAVPVAIPFYWWLCHPLGPEASTGAAGLQLDAEWEETEGPQARAVHPRSALAFLQTGRTSVLGSLVVLWWLALLSHFPVALRGMTFVS